MRLSDFGEVTLTSPERKVDDESGAEDRGGTLLPQPKLRAGCTFLAFDIDRIGLKDAGSYVQPHFTVSVYGTCCLLRASLDNHAYTPFASQTACQL